jgi:putative hydrolase of the HAD superfamily
VVALDHSAYSRTITVSDGTLAALRALRDRGLRLGIVSNVTLLPELMRADLDALGILPLLDGTTFSSEVGTRKPDPAIFRDALDKVGVEAARTVFVGDRLLDDIGGARAAGMRSVLTREFRQEEPGHDLQPDAVIDRLADLPAALDGLSG